MSKEALLVSHVHAVGGPDNELVPYDFVLLGEGLLADDALLILLLLAEGLHDFIFSLPLHHHSPSQVLVVLPTHFDLFFLFVLHIYVCHLHSSYHALGLRLLIHHGVLIYRWNCHGIFGWSNWGWLRLLIRGYIDWLLLRRRWNWNSLFLHLVDNRVRNFGVKHIYDCIQRLFLP